MPSLALQVEFRRFTEIALQDMPDAYGAAEFVAGRLYDGQDDCEPSLHAEYRDLDYAERLQMIEDTAARY